MFIKVNDVNKGKICINIEDIYSFGKAKYRGETMIYTAANDYFMVIEPYETVKDKINNAKGSVR